MHKSIFKLAAILAVLIACAGCGAGSGAPVDPVVVRDLLDYQLYMIQTGIEREDPVLASTPIDDNFTMASSITARYNDGNWEGSGPASFRGFLNRAFELHANISCELLLIDVVQQGDLATATVETNWRSQRTDNVPPGQYVSEEVDYFFFQRTGSAWRLLRWQETPDPAPPFE